MESFFSFFFCANLIKSLFIADFRDIFHIWISEPVTGLSGGKKNFFEVFWAIP